MSLDVIAYLWFGTKPTCELPEPWVGKSIDWINQELKGNRLQVVQISATTNEETSYALAFDYTVKEHDWRASCGPFNIIQPVGASSSYLIDACEKIGWKTNYDEIGWHLTATAF